MLFILKVFFISLTLMYLKYKCDSRKLIRTEAVIRDEDMITMNFKVNVRHFCNETKITGIKEHTVRVSVDSDTIGAKCNEKLINYLADLLNTTRSNFLVTKGARSIKKTLTLTNTSLTVMDVIQDFKKEVYRDHAEPEYIPIIQLKG